MAPSPRALAANDTHDFLRTPFVDGAVLVLMKLKGKVWRSTEQVIVNGTSLVSCVTSS